MSVSLNVLPYNVSGLILNNNLTSTYASVQTQASPKIVFQPISVSGASGSSFSFSVTGSNVSNLGYQWRFNGSVMTGVTGNVLTISNASSSNTGQYYVVIYNSYGYAGSNLASLILTGSGSTGSGGGTGGGVNSGIPSVYVYGISGLPTNVGAGNSVTIYMTGTGFDPSTANFFWEGSNIQNSSLIGNSGFTFSNTVAGPQWLESEITLIDGTKLMSTGSYNVQLVVTNFIENYGVSGNPNTRYWYKLDGNNVDSLGKGPPMTLTGTASYDSTTFLWSNRPTGQAVLLNGINDYLTMNTTVSGSNLFSVEAMFYISSYYADGIGNSELLDIDSNFNRYFRLRRDIYNGLNLETFENNNIAGPPLLTSSSGVIPTNTWCNIKLQLDSVTGFSMYVNGVYITGLNTGNLLVNDNWVGNGATLNLGSYFGWIDEVVVKQS